MKRYVRFCVTLLVAIPSAISLSGCLQDAQALLKSQTIELLENDTVSNRVAGECIFYTLSEKEIRVSSDGSVDLIVSGSSSETAIQVCGMDSQISGLYAGRIGVKNLSEKAINSSDNIKEAILREASDEVDKLLNPPEEIESTRQ